MNIIIKLVVFVLVTVLLMYFSRKSLPHRQRHGFYRFFAWEAIVGLILLNIDYWFIKPFSVWQIISWVILLFSLLLALNSIYALQFKGMPSGDRKDEFLFGLEKTTKLVTTGAYKYIRHPMYSSLFWLAWGLFFKSPSWPGLILSMIASLFLVLTARFEEKENVNYFGQEYTDYIKQTKMFVPYIF